MRRLNRKLDQNFATNFNHYPPTHTREPPVTSDRVLLSLKKVQPSKSSWLAICIYFLKVTQLPLSLIPTCPHANLIPALFTPSSNLRQKSREYTKPVAESISRTPTVLYGALSIDHHLESRNRPLQLFEKPRADFSNHLLGKYL